MRGNILDAYKIVSIKLREPITLKQTEPTGKKGTDGKATRKPIEVVVIPMVEIIQFDLIGVLIDYEENIRFIPWSNIVSISPELDDVPFADREEVEENV